MTFRFLAPAQEALLEAVIYYARINAELCQRFEQSVAKAVRAAADHLERGAPRSENARRWLVQGFPFGVMYREGAGKILRVAVAHQRKQPGYWARHL